MKKITAVFLAILFGASMLCGCGLGRKFYEYGDFMYSEWVEDTVYLDGLSEQGKEEEVVIVPEKINGVEVGALSYKYGMGSCGALKSEKLTTLYVIPSVIINGSGTFSYCKSLQKIVFINVEGWRSFYYYPPNNENLKIYYCRAYQGSFADSIGYYANTSYMYNYEGSRNEGYYWVDNFEYGTKIGYIPENPEREGYVFGGWFKETECENIWDFEKDTLPDAEIDEDGEEIYQETKLYAKWYKK